MPSWYLKASLQGILSRLPNSTSWNYLFQRHVSKGLRLGPKYFETKLAICDRHLQNYRVHRQEPLQRALELGTGWLPIIPIGLYLCGVDHIISIDIQSLTRRNLTYETISLFVQYANEDKLSKHLPLLKAERMDSLIVLFEQLESISTEDILSHLNIQSIVQDVRDIQIPPVNFIISNSTFEHIPPEILDGILSKFYQLLNDDGLMSHLIDLSDHYSHFDRTLTKYHFLQYSDARWRKYDNDLLYQNRLRITNYRNLHQQNNFDILEEDNNQSLSELPQGFQLAEKFTQYTLQDLLVNSSWMISQPIRVTKASSKN